MFLAVGKTCQIDPVEELSDPSVLLESSCRGKDAPGSQVEMSGGAAARLKHLRVFSKCQRLVISPVLQQIPANALDGSRRVREIVGQVEETIPPSGESRIGRGKE